MKSFLKYTLATMVGFILVIFLWFLIALGMVSAIVASSDKETVLKDNSVLEIKLDGEVVDRSTDNPFENLDIPLLSSTKKIGIDLLKESITKAKNEDKVKGIYLRIDDVSAGYADCEEIRSALVDFKSSGKFIYAYSETYSQKAYYLASVADKIFINPEGSLMFTGISSSTPYFSKALDKLGVEVQVIRHGKFKAAVEPYILDKMSPENKEQIETYIGSIWNNVLGEIATSRNTTVSALNSIADENMYFRHARKLISNNLVDSLVYEDQVLDFLKSKAGIESKKDIPFVTVSELKNVPAKRESKGLAKNKIAVIYAAGEIAMESSSSMSEEGISGLALSKEIREARQDSSIKAIVLRVNSPGGSALASELIWREVKLAAEQKPTVVSMGNLAASGGYYIACAADSIVANPTTLTGSIGVFGLIPNANELIDGKLGIKNEVVKTNKLSDMPSLTRALTDEEEQIMQEMVENVYSTFVSHVAEGRNMTYEQVDAIGQGRVWTGENALKLGLVDKLGDLDDAIAIAKNMAKLDTYRVVKLPKETDPIEELMKGFSTKMKMSILEKELGSAVKYYKSLESIKNSSGILARIPHGLELE
ncbi:MAG TPA: signal peptide peptidase SppA [Prolixibacteraceae bacterium]|nr:signal peptide peptidase SppA [Prolixibacteraceae bacterium]